MKNADWRIPVAATGIALILYWAIGASVGPGLVRGQLSALLAGSSDQQLGLDKLQFDPFKLTAKFAGLRLENVDSGPILSIASGHLRFSVTGFFGDGIAVKDLYFDQPELSIVVTGTPGNRRIVSLGGFQPASAGDQSRPPVSIAHARIDRGQVTVVTAVRASDGSASVSTRLSDISAEVTDIVSATLTPAAFALTAIINTTGQLKAAGTWVPANRAVEADVQLGGLELSPFAGLIQNQLIHGQLSGVLSANGQFRLHAGTPGFEGALSVAQPTVTDDSGTALLEATKLSAHEVKIGGERAHATVAWMELERPHAELALDASGQLNLRALLTDTAPRIDKTTVRDGILSFTDARLPIAVHINAHNIAGEVNWNKTAAQDSLAITLAGDIAGLENAARTNVPRESEDDKNEALKNGSLKNQTLDNETPDNETLENETKNNEAGKNKTRKNKASEGGTLVNENPENVQWGHATLDGVIHVNEHQLQGEGDVTLSAVDASLVSAYFSSLTDREILGGSLGLNLHYHLSDTVWTFSTTVALADFALGTASAQAKAAFGSPLDLTVALLTNERGRITFELPVQVTVADSEPYLQQAFAKTLGDFVSTTNSMANTIVAQLSGMDSLRNDDLSPVIFAAGSTGIMPAANNQLAAWVTALGRRPLLGLRAQGYYSAAADRAALSRRQVEQHVALAASTRAGMTSAEVELDFSDPKVRGVLDEFAAARLNVVERDALSKSPQPQGEPSADIKPDSYYPAVFAALVAKESVSDYALRQLARYRAHSLLGRLQELGIDSHRLEFDKRATAVTGDLPASVKLTAIAAD